MFWKFLAVLSLLITLSACTPSKVMEAPAAQAQVQESWSADQHITWEIEWPDAPIGGPLTVETWRAGGRYRFEILESPAPALVGATLIFDGQSGWLAHRFEAQAPAPIPSPMLSPVSEAMTVIEELVATPPAAATQEATKLNQHPVHKFILTYAEGRSLTFWRDDETGLPVRVVAEGKGQPLTLKARSFEQLPQPVEGLFAP